MIFSDCLNDFIVYMFTKVPSRATEKIYCVKKLTKIK